VISVIKRIGLLIAVALMAVMMMVATAAPAFAAITQSGNNGHPNTNPAGKCPIGQNRDATPGALKKCS
jgi:hypothetical protein